MINDRPYFFPKITDLGLFTDSEIYKDERIDDEALVKSLEGFKPDFNITNEFNEDDYWTSWEGKYDASSGVTGLWMPEESRMVVSRRNLAHHNQQVSSLMDKDLLGNTLIPWVVDFNGHSENWNMDIPSSAGGLYQIIARENLDVNDIRTGSQFNVKHFWPICYTCHLLDVPFSTRVRLSYVTDRLERLRRNSDKSLDITQFDEFRLGYAYREMMFELGELPEPKINRGLLIG